jgi:hypothetical protein
VSTLTAIAGCVLVAVSAVAAAQQLLVLRGAGRERPTGPMRRAVVSESGRTLRLSLVSLFFGLMLLFFWGPSSAGGWLVVGFMAAILGWDRGLWLKARVEQTRKSDCRRAR